MHIRTNAIAAAMSFAALMAFAVPAKADQATCDLVKHATGQVRNIAIKETGYDFSKDTPDIYGSGQETCARLRDDTVGGHPATVYSQDFVAPMGSTHALIWVSKADGKALRIELDGHVKGKGDGHESGIAK